MEYNSTELKSGKHAKIKSIEGGTEFARKMSLLNIRAGKKIKKIASHPLKGPIVIEIDSRKIAIGRGMAKKIIVEASK